MQNSELNQARVKQRISEGGHDVPLVDEFIAFDNSCYDDPYQKIFHIRHQQLQSKAMPLPDWVNIILKDNL